MHTAFIIICPPSLQSLFSLMPLKIVVGGWQVEGWGVRVVLPPLCQPLYPPTPPLSLSRCTALCFDWAKSNLSQMPSTSRSSHFARRARTGNPTPPRLPHVPALHRYATKRPHQLIYVVVSSQQQQQQQQQKQNEKRRKTTPNRVSPHGPWFISVTPRFAIVMVAVTALAGGGGGGRVGVPSPGRPDQWQRSLPAPC